MGRNRQYATATERQAAYRQRMKATTIWVNRAPFERMSEATMTLQTALERASHHGNRLACDLVRATPEETLAATVAWVLSSVQQSPTDEAQRLDTTTKG